MVDGNVQWITTSSNPKSHTQTGCVCNGSIGNRANGASDPTLACAGKMRRDDVKEDPETLFVHSVSPAPDTLPRWMESALPLVDRTDVVAMVAMAEA
eukprot:g7887.t1 g7887   contig26:506791-507081(-)